MGRIIVLANPLDPEDRVEYQHSGPFINWLTEHYPKGFETPHVASLNVQRLLVENYDTVLGEDDVLVLGIFPAAPAFFMAAPFGMSAFWAGITSFVVGTVISIGLSYAINALFGPKGASPTAPRAQGSTPVAGSVYSMSIPTNTARIGQPIPAVYGRNILVPDLAAQPYAFYRDNQQYVDQILCLGHGEFEVEEVKVAATNVAELASGIVTYYQIPSSWHQKTFGIIQDSTGIRENVYTSLEVSDQEFYAASGGVFTTGIEMWNGCFIDCDDEGITGNFWLSDQAAEYAEAHRDGAREVYMVIADGPNAGTWRMAYLVHSGNTGERAASWMYQRGFIDGYFDAENNYVARDTWFSSGRSTVTLTYTRPGSEQEGGPIGPFAASPSCMLTELLQYDVVWPNGCYKLGETGGLEPFSVAGTFLAELVDNAGVALGPSYLYEWYETLATNTPQRRSYDHVVPKGRYRVTGARGSAKSDRGQDQSACYWVGLKSILGPYCDDPQDVYGDVTLLAVRIKATEGLSSASHNRISVKATRKLNGVTTRHPVDAFRDIFTEQKYGGRRPLTELDTAALETVRAEVPDCKFDGIFDQKGTLWEALKLSVQMIRGIPITDGSVVSLVRDKPHSAPVAAFSQDNITSLSRAYLFVEADDFDGVEGEYVDPLDGSKQYVIWPTNSANPESMTLWGCTSMARAQCFIQQWWQQKSLRRRLTTFETELDAHVLLLGDPINITHPVLGPSPVLHVVSAVKPKDELHVEVEAFVYEPGVFA